MINKQTLDKAIDKAIVTLNFNELALQGGHEVTLTNEIATHNGLWAPERTIDNFFGGTERLDIVEFIDQQTKMAKGANRYVNLNEIHWAMEAKHFSPHQRSSNAISFVQYSLGGPVLDILKLSDCNIEKFYIVPIQTQITDIRLKQGASLANLKANYGFINKYVKPGTFQGVMKQINRINNMNFIGLLEQEARRRLDAKLIRGSVPRTISSIIADIDVSIHYFVCGPFNAQQVKSKMPSSLNPKLSYESQVGDGKKLATWDIDVSI